VPAILKRKHRRLVLLLACGLGLGSATALVLSAFRQNLVFFVLPSDLAAQHPSSARTLRLGGLVEAGSVRRSTQGKEVDVRFRITDGHTAVPVTFNGVLPDLFREGQGVVALGTLGEDGTFHASEVLAKHDETYMPKDVAEALKRKGLWNPAKGPPPPASTWNTLTVPVTTPAAAAPATSADERKTGY
jgi:cytochrome c-type biogenesis protein CcmE